jgi:hypothetical protein
MMQSKFDGSKTVGGSGSPQNWTVMPGNGCDCKALIDFCFASSFTSSVTMSILNCLELSSDHFPGMESTPLAIIVHVCIPL